MVPIQQRTFLANLYAWVRSPSPPCRMSVKQASNNSSAGPSGLVGALQFEWVSMSPQMHRLLIRNKTHQSTLRATSSNFSNPRSYLGGGKGIGSTRKSRLEMAGDSDVISITGEVSLSTASLIAGRIVCSRRDRLRSWWPGPPDSNRGSSR